VDRGGGYRGTVTLAALEAARGQGAGPVAAARPGPPEPPGRPVPDIAARPRPDGGTRLAPDPVPLHWDSPTRPTVPLAARDGIILPGHGPIRRGWGEPGPDGEPLRGLQLGLPPGAPILAPLDGTVRYAGYFAGLGPILIIAHAGGYHSLIAGVGSIDVQPGQEVLAGEPVATMRSPGRLQDPAVSLYYELRFQGRPIPPISGLAAAQRRGRG
jgi:murein DD-endopeptidase MepM/ murein hydrolase activator NlpD